MLWFGFVLLGALFLGGGISLLCWVVMRLLGKKTLSFVDIFGNCVGAFVSYCFGSFIFLMFIVGWWTIICRVFKISHEAVGLGIIGSIWLLVGIVVMFGWVLSDLYKYKNSQKKGDIL